MKLWKYIKFKMLDIIIFLLSIMLSFLLLNALKVDKVLILFVVGIYTIPVIIIEIKNFLKRKKYYDEIKFNLNNLDKKYLILETLNAPDFYEGVLLSEILYEVDKSMAENVNCYAKNINDFKEYIEFWIHEAKLPISTLTLLCHNHKDKITKSVIDQVKRLDNYIDEVLYYTRSNCAEEDFHLKEVALDKVISSVALKNKDDILENDIDLIVKTRNLSVYTDSKWLEFIINQIINNAIKYKRDDVKSFIKIYAIETKKTIELYVWDNGIGIAKEDLPKVFNKSFTGKNGSKKVKSTGMGLYIVNNLCKKLGHKINVYSKEGNLTIVRISFGKNDYYDV